MPKIKLLFRFLPLLCTSINIAYAGNQPSQTFSAQSIHNALINGHIVFQLGAYQGIQGDQQHIGIPTLIGDDFSLSRRRDENALVGIGYFIDGQQYPSFTLSYGLNLFYLAPMKVNGDVTQESLYTNLSYEYKLSHLPLFFIVKSDFYTRSPAYSITIDAGVGPNFMLLRNFKEQAINPISEPDSPFSNTTSIQLAATLGAGVKMHSAYTSKPLECGYRFFYLGNGRFDHNSQVSDSLKTGNTYANAVICSVSFN